jgi:hypothetical protein
MTTTHKVLLWLNNEETLYRRCVSICEDALADKCLGETHAPSARMWATDVAALEIENLVCEDMPCMNGMWGDIISDAISNIDFEEIAKDFMDDLEVWSVFSSDSEEAALFTSLDAAKEYLLEKLGEIAGQGTYDITEAAIQSMGDGDKVTITSTEYAVLKS